MKTAILPLFIVFGNHLIGQQSSVSGVVAVFNSAFETGKRQYVSNAQVEDDFKKANATTTSIDGHFKLVFVGIKDNQKVSFNVKKEKMEIVNTEVLYAVAGQKEQVALFMSPQGKIAENKLKYYNINREAAEKALTTKLKILGEEILKLKQNETANAGQIEKLHIEYNSLQKQHEKIDQSAMEMAERYAKTNLDVQTKEYQAAFRFFQKGQLEEALKILNQVDLEKAGRSIMQEQERNRTIDKEWFERDSIKNEKKRQVTEGLSFKAQLHNTQFEFNKVEETYQLLLKLDSTNLKTLADFASFLDFQNKDSKSIFLYKKAFEITREAKEKAKFLNNLGNLHWKNKYIDAAKKYYFESLFLLSELEKKYPREIQNKIGTICNNLGVLYFEVQQMDSASIYLKRSLQTTKLLTTIDSIEKWTALYSTLCNLGNLFDKNNDPEQAENSYLEALDLARQLFKRDSNLYLKDLAVVLNNLGRLYENNQEIIQAELLYNEALAIRRKMARLNPDAFLDDFGDILSNLGTFYAKNQNPKRAEENLTEALSIRKYLGNKNPNANLHDYAKALENIAIFYRNHQKQDEAQKLFEQAVSTYKQVVNNNPDAFIPDLASCLSNLGAYYIGINEFSKAKNALQEALLMQRLLAKQNPVAFGAELVITLNNLGIVLEITNHLTKADTIYQEAALLILKLVEINPDKFALHYGTILISRGNLYLKMLKISQAESMYNQGLKFIEGQIDSSNQNRFLPLKAKFLTNLASLYSQNNTQPEKTKTFYTEALTAFITLNQMDSVEFKPWIALLYSNFGLLLSKDVKLSERLKAESYLNKALTINKALRSKSPNRYLPEIAKNFYGLAQIYESNQDSINANYNYHEALIVQLELVSKNSELYLPDLAKILSSLGGFYYIYKDYVRSEKNRLEALSLFQKLQNANESFYFYDVFITMLHLANTYLQIGDTQKEIKYLESSIILVEKYVLLDNKEYFQFWEGSIAIGKKHQNMFIEVKNYLATTKLSKLIAESTDKLIPGNKNLIDSAANEYGNLSWHALFSKEFDLAEKAAKRSLELNSTQNWVNKNLGHAYFLKGQVKQAKATYKLLQGKKDQQQGKSFKEILLLDLKKIENAGISDLNLQEIKKWIEEWRQ